MNIVELFFVQLAASTLIVAKQYKLMIFHKPLIYFIKLASLSRQVKRKKKRQTKMQEK